MKRYCPPARRILSICVPVLFAMVPGCKPSGASIQNKGSDTMVELAQALAENYGKASIEVSGGGSGVGISALIAGTVDICNSSRAMSESEIELTKKNNNGKAPVQHVVGYDALAIYVHKANPLNDISVEQLAQIYGDAGKATKWSDLGVKVPGCEKDEIVRMSRQNNSGTYEYFKEAVLGKDGKYKLGTIDASGSRDLVAQVAHLPCAIGYSGMGYNTPEVKMLMVKKGNGAGVLPSIKAVHDKTYPISRPLYMYTVGEATGAIKDYIDWVRGPEGQKILEKTGYVPLSAVTGG